MHLASNINYPPEHPDSFTSIFTNWPSFSFLHLVVNLCVSCLLAPSVDQRNSVKVLAGTCFVSPVCLLVLLQEINKTAQSSAGVLMSTCWLQTNETNRSHKLCDEFRLDAQKWRFQRRMIFKETYQPVHDNRCSANSWKLHKRFPEQHGPVTFDLKMEIPFITSRQTWWEKREVLSQDVSLKLSLFQLKHEWDDEFVVSQRRRWVS